MIAWPQDNQIINGLAVDDRYVYFSVGPGPILRQLLDPSQPLHLDEFASIRYPIANADGSLKVMPRVLKEHWLYYVDMGDGAAAPAWTLRAKNTQTLTEKVITSGNGCLIDFNVDGDTLAWIETARADSQSGQANQCDGDSRIQTIQLSSQFVRVLDRIPAATGATWVKIALAGKRLIAVRAPGGGNPGQPLTTLFDLTTGDSVALPLPYQTCAINVALSGAWLACRISETKTALYNFDTHRSQTFEELLPNDSEVFPNAENIADDWLYWSGSTKGNLYNLAQNRMVSALPTAGRTTHLLEMAVDGTIAAWISLEPSGYVIEWKDLQPVPDPIPNGAGLTIEENQIVGEPQLDSASFFQPLHGTQQEVMDRHAGQRQPNYQIPFEFVNGGGVLTAMNGDSRFRAIASYTSGANGRASIQVKQGETVVFHKDGLVFSPVEILRSLWVDGSHWTLEIAYTPDQSTDIAGQVYRDGVLLNQKYAYKEMFGYLLLDGKPLYFYQKEGQVHLSYAGQDLPIAYDRVPHYGCCSSAQLNPHSGPNWLTFWGLRGGIWYYVEIGRY